MQISGFGNSINAFMYASLKEMFSSENSLYLALWKYNPIATSELYLGSTLTTNTSDYENFLLNGEIRYEHYAPENSRIQLKDYMAYNDNTMQIYNNTPIPIPTSTGIYGNVGGFAIFDSSTFFDKTGNIVIWSLFKQPVFIGAGDEMIIGQSSIIVSMEPRVS